MTATENAVRDDLERATEHHRQMETHWKAEISELRRAEGLLEEIERGEEQLQHDLQTTRRQRDRLRREVERHKKRARQLAESLERIHGSLFHGNIFDLILEACLNLSGATGGMYVTVREEEALRIRAAVAIDNYPDDPPSDYIRALCRQALESQESLVCNTPGQMSDLPRPGEGERFRNLIAAPVVLRQNLSGVIIVVNKRRGKFEQHDAELLVSVGNQASVAVENIRLRRQLQEAYLSTVGVLADAMEAKDSYTQGHCEAVSHYSRLIADRLGLSTHDRSVVCYTALLHDVGKIGVSDAILNKPGPLLPHELELVRAHVRVGYSLLQRIPALRVVAEAVLHHHEWFDGTGYPDGLSGEQIPIASRIVGVVDAFSAMTTSRCYRQACSEEVAREELIRCAGRQFDPRVVEAFLFVLDAPESRPGDDDDEPECGAPPGFHLAADPPPSLMKSGAGKE